MSKEQPSKNLDLFERKVVFRTARGYFLFLAVTAILMFVFGAFMGASGVLYTLPDEPQKPALPPEVPEPAPLTFQDVEKFKKAQKTSDEGVEVVEDPEPEFAVAAGAAEDIEETQLQKNRRELQELLEELKTLFPEPEYSWQNQYETRCVRSSPYGCLKRSKDLVKKGIVEVLSSGITKREDSDFSLLLPLLRDVRNAVKAAPVHERGSTILPAMEAHRARWNEYHRNTLGRELEVGALLADYDRAVMDHKEDVARIEAEQSDKQMMGMYGVLFGLGCLVFVGVFLAHLAIERHLRELRQIMAGG